MKHLIVTIAIIALLFGLGCHSPLEPGVDHLNVNIVDQGSILVITAVAVDGNDDTITDITEPCVMSIALILDPSQATIMGEPDFIDGIATANIFNTFGSASTLYVFCESDYEGNAISGTAQIF